MTTTDSLVVFGQHAERVLDQLVRCAEAGDAPRAVLCADGHLGYSQPIGGVVAYRDHVSPSGVGYDIACGNKAVKTNLRPSAFGYKDVVGLADEIARRISFGIGRDNSEPAFDHPVLDSIREAEFPGQRALLDLAANQLGTVGAGNHYVDLFEDDDGWLWVGVHFGSRGFGHKTANGFLSLAQGGSFQEKGREGEMDAPPTLLGVHSELGQAYVAAMGLAGEYAYAGRDVVCDKVLEILGAEAVDEVHNHHNFAWAEEHGGERVVVVRKGATPAFPGQRGFVGGSMGEPSVILRGVESERSADALYSTVHGAGRAMSRTRAAGKFVKAYGCMDRDCSRTFQIDGVSAHNGPPKRGVCPDHPEARVKKVRGRVRAGGEVDWKAVGRRLAADRIVLRGGAADEAPEAYKRLPDVLREHEGTVEIEHELRPFVVVMAGADVVDPYKD